MIRLSSQLLPSSSFRHIGVMIFFMSFIAYFSVLAFLYVSNITTGWLNDLGHGMTIEIPSYQLDTETILSDQDIKDTSDKINLLLNDDPAIINYKAQTSIPNDFIKTFNIPLPIFIHLTLHEDRAKNTHTRLANKIKNIAPNVIIKTNEEWENDIIKTATRLKIIFCGLTLSIFIVTTIVIIGIIHTQLKASQSTIELFHIMGASPSKIAYLFQMALLRPCLWGALSAIALVVTFLIFIQGIYHFEFSSVLLYGSLLAIIASFIILGLSMTRWVVMRALWVLT